MKHFLIVLLLLSVFVGLAGCAGKIFKNPKTISTQDIDPPSMKVIGKAYADQQRFFLLHLIPFGQSPKELHESLLAEAESMGGNAVIDVQYDTETIWFWLFRIDTTEATGKAVLIK